MTRNSMFYQQSVVGDWISIGRPLTPRETESKAPDCLTLSPDSDVGDKNK